MFYIAQTENYFVTTIFVAGAISCGAGDYFDGFGGRFAGTRTVSAAIGNNAPGFVNISPEAVNRYAEAGKEATEAAGHHPEGKIKAASTATFLCT